MGVSVQATNRFLANHAMKLYDFDPDGVNPVDIDWVPFHSFFGLVVGFFRTVGAGAVDTLQILANTKADGSGDDVVVKVKDLTGIQPDAVGDQVWLEVTAEEIRQACTDAGKVPAAVSASVEFNVATDEGVVVYIRYAPRFAKDGLTADLVA
ncbi:MAG: hypothetical protein R3E85_18055 [Planctomycetota bacterium]